MQREVWFEKVAWSYVPCHWKGFAVMAAIIIPTVTAILLEQMTLNRLGYPNADLLAFAIFFVPALFSLLVIAKRHS
ncbi:hypothetical protein [Sphingomonas sp. Leaf4]|uniref:hypothetical protein n=1 Tax=Sphingomonas sp. Leaf4 TaxID=2876553 RepID=UPI001E5E7DE8|nr:hypothetical protein [Sphingomonas sp. Leaf4]